MTQREARPAELDWRRLASDQNVGPDVARSMWERALIIAASDPVKTEIAFKRMLDEAVAANLTPEPGRGTLVDAAGVRDPASLGPGKTTRVLEEQKSSNKQSTGKSTVAGLRNDLTSAAQAGQNAAEVLAASDPATIVQALRELRESGGPGLLHKLMSVAGGAIERILGERSPDPKAEIAEHVGEQVPPEPANASAALSEMSQQFGHSFDDVKIHVGKDASAKTGELSTKAVTVGRDIYFADGAFDPGSAEGKRVLAHELTHVVQQRNASPAAQPFTAPVGDRGNEFEQEAHRASDAVAAGKTPTVALTTSAPVAMREEAQSTFSTTASITDILEPLSPQAYADRNGAEIQKALLDGLATNDLSTYSDYLQWAIGTVAVAIVKRAFGATLVGPAGTVLKNLLLGLDVNGAITRGRTDPATHDWDPNVGLELTALFLIALAASFKRVGPRYVMARNQALLEVESKKDHTDAVIDAEAAPQPAVTAIISSHPLDSVVISTYIGGAVRLDFARYRKDHPEETKKHAVGKLRKVALKLISPTWAQVSDPADATAEEVSNALWGTPTNSCFITAAAPLFGMDAKGWEGASGPYLEEYLKLASTSGATSGDPLTTIGSGGAAFDATAKSQSQNKKLSGLSASDVVTEMYLLAEAIGDVIAEVTPFGLAAPLAGTKKRLDDRAKKVAGLHTMLIDDMTELTTWSSNVSAQKAIVSRAAEGVKAAIGQATAFQGRKGKDPKMSGAFQGLVDVPKNVARAYVSAIAISDLPDSASVLMTAADDAKTVMPIAIGEALLGVIRAMFDNAKGLEKHGLPGANSVKNAITPVDRLGFADDEARIRKELAGLHSTITSDPQKAAAVLERVQAELSDLFSVAEAATTIGAIAALLAQLENNKSLIGAIPSTDKNGIPLEGTSKNQDYTAYQNLLLMFKGELESKVLTPFASKDPAVRKQAAAELHTLQSNPVLAGTLTHVPKFIKKQEEFEAWAKLAAMIGVSFVSAGLGELAVALTGAKGIAALAVGTVAEATAQTVFSAAFESYGAESHLLMDMVTNLGSTLAFKTVMPLLNKGTAIALKSKLGQGMVNWTLVYGAMCLTKITIALAKTGGQKPSDEVMHEILKSTAIELAGGFIFHMFHAHLFGDLHAKVSHDPSLAGELATADKARQAIADSAKALESNAKAAGDAAAGSNKAGGKLPDPEPVLQKAKAQLEAQKALLAGPKMKAFAETLDAKDAKVLADETAANRQQLYEMNRQLLYNMLTPFAGDTWLCPRDRMAEATRLLKELGYFPAGVEPGAVHAPGGETLKDKAFTLRFDPAVGELAPLEPNPRTLRIADMGPGSLEAKPREITPEAWKGTTTLLAAGNVPPITDFLDTPSNTQGHVKLEKLMADPELGSGDLLALRNQFMKELAARIKADPTSDLNAVMESIANEKVGDTFVYKNKGRHATKTDVKNMGGLVKGVSLQAGLANRIITEPYYAKVKAQIEAARITTPGAYPKVDLVSYDKLTFDKAGPIAEYIADNTATLGDPSKFLDESKVIGGRDGGSTWWMAKDDGKLTDAKAYQNSTAAYADYGVGTILLELPMELATETMKVTAFDGMGQDLYKANPDVTAPTGLTAPDPTNKTGAKPAREVILPPTPLSKIPTRSFIGRK